MNTPAMLLHRPVFGLLACLLVTHLAGCNPTDTETPSSASPKAIPEQTQTPLADLNKSQESRGLLPEPVMNVAQPKSASAIKLVIEANLATDLVDIEALQSGRELPVPPFQLSVDLFQAPLRAVLKELARELNAKVSITDDVLDELISLQFNDMNVDEAIKQLLRDTNYVLIYKESATILNQNQRTDKSLAAGIAEIRVFPKRSTGEEISAKTGILKALEPTDLAAQLEEWKKQALTAESPEDRLTAIKQFLEHADPKEHNALLTAAFEDKSPLVRRLALNSMGDSKNPLFEPISKVALNDEDPQTRASALNVLVSQYGDGATSVSEQALTDPDPNVQKTAKNSLEMAQRIKALLHNTTQ